MAVPEVSDLLTPLLETIKDKDEYKVTEITDEVIEIIDISDEDMEKRLPNNERIIESRISTANTYLKKAELIESNRFLYYNITEEGLKILEDNPDGINEENLMEIPSFREYKQVFIHDDVDEEDLPSFEDALKQNMIKQMEEVRNEISKDVMKENRVKYFQPKNQNETGQIYEIKSHRPVSDIKKEDLKDVKFESDYEKEYFKSDESKHKHEKEHSKSEKKKCKSKKHKCKKHKHKKLKYVIFKDFSPADELLKYAELFERGYLTKEDFEKKKIELLNL